MGAGSLRERIELQKRVITRDALGEETVTWQRVDVIWAALKRISTKDVLAAQQMHAELSAVFIARYRDDISEDWRILWRGDIYSIIGRPLDEDGKKRYITIYASAGVKEE